MGFMMSSYKLYCKPLATLCLCTLIVACEPPTTMAEIEFRVPVTTEDVRAATIEDRIVTTGTLRAPELVTLTVMTAGLLQIEQGSNGRLAEGDHVKAGDQIGSITGEDVRLATRREAALQKLQTAERNLEATTTLYEQGLVTVSQYGMDQNAFEEAKLEYERSLHTENRNNIITPIDGVILSLARDSNGQPMANGQLVSQGQAIAQIAPLVSAFEPAAIRGVRFDHPEFRVVLFDAVVGIHAPLLVRPADPIDPQLR